MCYASTALLWTRAPVAQVTAYVAGHFAMGCWSGGSILMCNWPCTYVLPIVFYSMRLCATQTRIPLAVAPFSRAEAAERKLAVPRADERPVFGIKSTKNFIVSNAVENILAGVVPHARACTV